METARAVGVELESRVRHCERSEAIHEVVGQRPFTVDCFVAALLAMTWFHLKAARSRSLDGRLCNESWSLRLLLKSLAGQLPRAEAPEARPFAPLRPLRQPVARIAAAVGNSPVTRISSARPGSPNRSRARRAAAESRRRIVNPDGGAATLEPPSQLNMRTRSRPKQPNILKLEFRDSGDLSGYRRPPNILNMLGR